jgi:hypothetical protein
MTSPWSLVSASAPFTLYPKGTLIWIYQTRRCRRQADHSMNLRSVRTRIVKHDFKFSGLNSDSEPWLNEEGILVITPWVSLRNPKSRLFPSIISAVHLRFSRFEFCCLVVLYCGYRGVLAAMFWGDWGCEIWCRIRTFALFDGAKTHIAPLTILYIIKVLTETYKG